jgi:hypothetical protein
MLLSENVLYIHVPKTGGMALTSHLMGLLPGRKVYTAPEPHPELLSSCNPDEVQYVRGSRHETLEEAQAILADLGYDVSRFSVVIAGTRNPYALEVSRYAYLQSGHAVDAGDEQDLAMNSDFSTFAVRSDRNLSSPIHRYYTIGGQIPANLRVIRQELLDDDLQRIMAELGIPCRIPVVRDNESLHDDYRSYYTPASEAAVYERYRWIFDAGWYERMDLVDFTPARSTNSAAHMLPVFGSVRQVGPTSGAYSDGWIGDELRFRVASESAVDYITIEAFIPLGRDQDITLQVGRDHFVGRFASGPLCWTVPCLIPPAAPVLITLTPSVTFIPAQEPDGSPDSRTLSFVLSRLTFSTSTPSRVSDNLTVPERLDDHIPALVGP